MDFREYIRKNVIKKQDRILEFGPLTRPLVQKKDYPNIFFADIRSTEDIKKMYTSNDYLKSTGISVDIDAIVDIDYIINDSYKETFKKKDKFDVVVLSHVIEHMPDIIFFFEDIKNILKDNGKLIIIYPDARYCFDHFRNGTSFIDAYEVYNKRKPNSGCIFDFKYNVIHENNPLFFWSGVDITNKLPQNSFQEAESVYLKARNGEMPEDVHFWPFSDYQFIKFLYDMNRAGLFEFKVDEFYQTEKNTQEFMVILSLINSKIIDYDNYRLLLNSVNPNSTIANARDINLQLEIKISNLNKKNDDLDKEISRLNKELSDIYTSKRWTIIEKIIKTRNKLTKLGR